MTERHGPLEGRHIVASEDGLDEAEILNEMKTRLAALGARRGLLAALTGFLVGFKAISRVVRQNSRRILAAVLQGGKAQESFPG